MTDYTTVYASVPQELKKFYTNYDESFQFLQKRKKRQVNQIVLLNNLQRGDENIASTLLVTLFNRILSNLYDDKMQVKFVPSEEIDQRKVNSINILAQNDYREMDKQKLDYDWDWDTLFFGRGYMETLRFDGKRKILRPSVINPLVFGYDPFFDEAQEWRYYWKWITKSSVDINKLIKAKVIRGISDAKDLPSGIDPYLWDYKIRREEAKEAVPQANDTHQGDIHQILEYYGYDEDGKKCVYWLDRNFSKMLYREVLDFKDAENGKDSKWPLVVKEAFREPHSSVVFSVADLLEDKHRARNVLLNLAFIAAKDKANPIYQFVPDNVIDQTQLFSRQINQHIPVREINNSIAPLNTANPMDNGLMLFMQTLNQEANDPVGTGMALTPLKKGKESATQAAIQQQLNDLAQSLQSKIMQFGEAEFWSHWYQRYRRFSKSGDTKIATIVGVKGLTFENIDLGDIHTKYPPGCLVFSAKEAEYKELVLRRDLAQLRPQLEQSLGPDGLRLFDKYVLLPKYLHDPTMLDIIIPKSYDEIKAEEENDRLNKEELVQVEDTDDHQQHLAVHRMAHNTWAKWIHIAWHEELLGMQRKQKQMQPQQPEQSQPQEGQQGRSDRGAMKQNQQESASPLKTALASNVSVKQPNQPHKL